MISYSKKVVCSLAKHLHAHVHTCGLCENFKNMSSYFIFYMDGHTCFFLAKTAVLTHPSVDDKFIQVKKVV